MKIIIISDLKNHQPVNQIQVCNYLKSKHEKLKSFMKRAEFSFLKKKQNVTIENGTSKY